MSLGSGQFDNIGDNFTLQLSPINKVIAFNFFTDGTTGETPSAYFKKEFRYSTDGGLNFTPYQDLTDPNLQAIVLLILKVYYIEVRYTRDGTDPAGSIFWDYFNLDVTQDQNVVSTACPVFFSIENLFCDIDMATPEFQELCGNLTDKMIKYGVMPLYVSDENEERTDDYIHFWETVCCWFTLHYIHASKFSNIYGNEGLLSDYLVQRGMFLCGDEDLATLQQIADDYYTIARRRGTILAIDEIKRILCVGECEEFIFVFIPKFRAGWVVDDASPMFRGVNHIQTYNKLPFDEHGYDINDLDNYHLSNPAQISLVAETRNDGEAVQAMHINNVVATTGINFQTEAKDLRMTVDTALGDPVDVDTQINYEISFFVKQEVLGSILSFGLRAFDCDGNEIASPTEEVSTSVANRYFFQTAQVINQTSEWVQIRGLIYNENAPTLTAAEALLNVGYGQELRFRSGQDISYIYPVIEVENGGAVPANSTKIYGVKVSIASNPYSMCFLRISGLVNAYYNNQNPSLSEAEVNKTIDRYMIPASSTLNVVEI